MNRLMIAALGAALFAAPTLGAAQGVAKIDRNGDGRVSAAELSNIAPEDIGAQLARRSYVGSERAASVDERRTATPEERAVTLSVGVAEPAHREDRRRRNRRAFYDR